MADDDPKKTAKADLESAIEKASKVVAAYGAVLEQEVEEPGILFHPESDLPYTKVKIRQAIELLLLVPTGDTKRNNLEVADIHLNSFVPDEDYGVVNQQLSGLSQSLKKLYSDEKMDGFQVVKTVGEGVTQEGQARLRQIEERVGRNNQTTLERHRELRREADRLRKAMT